MTDETVARLPRVLKANGILPIPQPTAKAARNAKIVQQYRNGVKWKEIAAFHSISIQTVARVLRIARERHWRDGMSAT